MRGGYILVFLCFIKITSFGQTEPNGYHIISDTIYCVSNNLLGWEKPENPLEGVRATVYFLDCVAYYKYIDSSWTKMTTHNESGNQNIVSDYQSLRVSTGSHLAELVRVLDFKDTVQGQVYIVRGGFFRKDTIGVDDGGTCIKSDSSNIVWKRQDIKEVLPDWWENKDDSEKIQAAVNYAKSGGKIIFLNREYILDDEIFLDSFQNVHFDGRKATLKASSGQSRNAILAAPYPRESYIIEVQTVPSSWEKGDILVMLEDQTNEGTSGRSLIDSIVGNKVYLRFYFTSQTGGPFAGQPVGTKVIKDLTFIRGRPTTFEAVYGDAGANFGTIIENFTFDGNKGDNNTESLAWVVNTVISLHGRGSEIRSNKFINAPSEVIVGHGINVHDNVFENCNGSIYHLSAHDEQFQNSYPAYFVNNTVINCNTTPYSVNGHNEGIVSFSWNGGYAIISSNYLVSGNPSNGIIGDISGYQTGPNDREIIILSNNYCKGFERIIYNLHQTTSRSIDVIGNIFEDCTVLAPAIYATSSIKICGNVQVGTTEFGIDFRNACDYQNFVDNSVGYGKNALLSTSASGNAAFGNFALQNTTSGNLNTGMGQDVGAKNTIGNKNTLMGSWAAIQMVEGDENTIIGHWSRGSSFQGSKNVHIGTESGRTNNGDSNVFIGYKAGVSTQGDNNLIIHNSDSGAPLIEGKFNQSVKINGNFSIGGPNFLKLPRLTNVERDALSQLEGGEMIFNITINKIQAYDGGMWVDLF